MDNYSKIYVKTYGSAPYNGNYIRAPEQDTIPPPWKDFFIKNSHGDIINNNQSSNDLDNPEYKSIGPTQVKLNVPTSSKPQTNLANPQNGYQRSSRGLPSLPYNSSEYNHSTAVIGRYTGIYTSARGRSTGSSGPLNPIKHWRKQLMPSQGHITGKPTLDSVVWTPGGTTVLHSNTDTSCCGITSSEPKNGMLFQYINNGFIDISNCNCDEVNVVRNSLSNYQPVYFNNPERVVRPRSSQTKIKKNYYTTGSAYLKSRVKLYEQNQLLNNLDQHTLSEKINSNMPPSNKNWEYAINQPREGSQAFKSTNCISDPSECCSTNNVCEVYVTFKPNNPFFAVQGAVDSSTRILQAKYKAITTNNNNFTQKTSDEVPYLNNHGLHVYNQAGTSSGVVTLPGATPIKYRGEPQAPYFIKSKYQRINACLSPFGINYQVSTHTRTRLNGIGNRQPSGGTGRTTTCFYPIIPTSTSGVPP